MPSIDQATGVGTLSAYASAAPWFTGTLVLLVCVNLMLQLWLLSRQARHVRQHRDAVPAAFAGRIALEAHRRAADYTLAKIRLELLGTAVGTAVLLGWTLLGGLDLLNSTLRGWIHDGEPGPARALAYQVTLLMSVMLIGGLIDLPLDLMRHFGVEQRHGFNRMSLGQYAQDALKGTLLTLVISAPLLAAILALMGQAGPWWWLWAFGVLAGFQLLMAVVVPTWIAPLFNRFTPLQDPALETRVRALMQRCGFSARELLVMDGSRRSAHANAYFTGLGQSKRVVFFDTLLKSLSPSEVEAVLAHELGHFRKRHITQRLVMMLGVSLVLLAVLGSLSSSPAFYLGLGVSPNLAAPNDGLALTLFTLVAPSALFLLTPLGAWWSRRHEYEADAFAAEHADRRALASALVKLHEDNASTLTPDPWFVRFHYSHPPAVQRLAALGLQHAPA